MSIAGKVFVVGASLFCLAMISALAFGKGNPERLTLLVTISAGFSVLGGEIWRIGGKR